MLACTVHTVLHMYVVYLSINAHTDVTKYVVINVIYNIRM